VNKLHEHAERIREFASVAGDREAELCRRVAEFIDVASEGLRMQDADIRRLRDCIAATTVSYIELLGSANAMRDELAERDAEIRRLRVFEAALDKLRDAATDRHELGLVDDIDAAIDAASPDTEPKGST
jgi:DNA repair exonuclease SbcCD ATPase subunit